MRKVNAEQGATDTGIPHEALLTEYNEVCSNFRTLTDIRFRLLAFLPIAAGVAVALSKENPYSLGLALPLFGLVATIGLATYNARNDQLYDELLGRAAAIERTLDIPDGAFANRPTAWLRIRLRGRKKEILEKCKRLLNSKWEIPEWGIGPGALDRARGLGMKVYELAGLTPDHLAAAVHDASHYMIVAVPPILDLSVEDEGSNGEEMAGELLILFVSVHEAQRELCARMEDAPVSMDPEVLTHTHHDN